MLIGPRFPSFRFFFFVYPPPKDLAHDLVNPPLLQPPDLLLERLNLAPAVERPAVVLAQAAHHLASRALDALRQLPHPPALLELDPQVLDRLGHLLAVGAPDTLLLLSSCPLLLGGGGGLGRELLLCLTQRF